MSVRSAKGWTYWDYGLVWEYLYLLPWTFSPRSRCMVHALSMALVVSPVGNRGNAWYSARNAYMFMSGRSVKSWTYWDSGLVLEYLCLKPWTFSPRSRCLVHALSTALVVSPVGFRGNSWNWARSTHTSVWEMCYKLEILRFFTGLGELVYVTFVFQPRSRCMVHDLGIALAVSLIGTRGHDWYHATITHI